MEKKTMKNYKKKKEVKNKSKPINKNKLLDLR